MKRIHEFEALRGLLALWVVVGHVLKHSGYMVAGLGPLGLLAQPGLPVDIFIILSGFVIFNLIDHKHEGYAPFIVRRFFRLYPVYLAAIVVGALFSATYTGWLQSFPWRTPFTEGTLAIVRDTNATLIPQLLTHLTMLHGLVPSSILPSSTYAIIGQAWSISVEWQFYLVAPLLFFALRNRPLVMIAIIAAIIVLHSRYWLGQGFAINQAGYFLVGIVCYFGYKNSDRLRLDAVHIWLGVAVAAMALVYFSTRPFSLVLWFVFLGAALLGKQGSANPITALCNLGPMQTLGRVSYSIYLCHIFVMTAVSLAILHLLDHPTQLQHMILLMAFTIPLTIGLSLLTFRFIEKPGMVLGQRLAKAVRPKTLIAENA
ncbi:MAG TPA: acyltransferase [Rhizomicrobium sp.]|jgi:peptidoglycan/LPS O-acetylase OafA/YrhL